MSIIPPNTPERPEPAWRRTLGPALEATGTTLMSISVGGFTASTISGEAQTVFGYIAAGIGLFGFLCKAAGTFFVKLWPLCDGRGRRRG